MCTCRHDLLFALIDFYNVAVHVVFFIPGCKNRLEACVC